MKHNLFQGKASNEKANVNYHVGSGFRCYSFSQRLFGIKQ